MAGRGYTETAGRDEVPVPSLEALHEPGHFSFTIADQDQLGEGVKGLAFLALRHNVWRTVGEGHDVGFLGGRGFLFLANRSFITEGRES